MKSKRFYANSKSCQTINIVLKIRTTMLKCLCSKEQIMPDRFAMLNEQIHYSQKANSSCSKSSFIMLKEQNQNHHFLCSKQINSPFSKSKFTMLKELIHHAQRAESPFSMLKTDRFTILKKQIHHAQRAD